uniref:Retinol binding protein 4 n=1 Tax=Pelusios castaneus TaxID=367368 RepID=A0A8C8RZG2_9SAUR
MAQVGKFLLWVLLVALGLLGSGCRAERDCRVSSFKVQENFNKARYSGTWYAMAKKDPEGLFLQDNVVAQFAIDENGQMSATAKGRVLLFNNWNVCADMIGSFTDTEDPAKFKMKYWGVASFLQRGRRRWNLAEMRTPQTPQPSQHTVLRGSPGSHLLLACCPLTCQLTAEPYLQGLLIAGWCTWQRWKRCPSISTNSNPPKEGGEESGRTQLASTTSFNSMEAKY